MIKSVMEKIFDKAFKKGLITSLPDYKLGSIGIVQIGNEAKKFCVEWNDMVKKYTLGVEYDGLLKIVAIVDKPSIHIITHPGKVHRDEFYAIAFLSAMEDVNVYVERRVPTISELEDKNIFVLDIGMDHTEELNNYDHHQWVGGDNAFTLLLKKYKITNKKVLALGEASRVLDTEGYHVFNKAYPAGFIFSELESMILLGLQDGTTSWSNGIKYIRKFFKYELITKPKQLQIRADLLDRNHEYLKDINTLVIKVPLAEIDGLDPALGVYEWCDANNIKEDIQIGWGIDRATQKHIVTIYITREGQIKGYNTNDIHGAFIFVHKKGFLATTDHDNIDSIVKVVREYIEEF